MHKASCTYVYAGVFFIGYALFQIPSNLALVRVGATVWLSGMLIVWGVVAALSAFVKTVPQFLLARFMLGIAECGAFPGDNVLSIAAAVVLHCLQVNQLLLLH